MIGLRPRLSWVAGVASALFLLSFTSGAQAALKWPTGTWDFVMSGPREGVALMTFSTNGTFVIHEVLVPKARRIPVTTGDQRDDLGDTGRSPGNMSTNSPLPDHTDIYGGESMHGPWGFDTRGRVVGYFYEITEPTFSTNTIQISSAVFTGPAAIAETNYSFQGREFCITLPASFGTNTVLQSSSTFTVTNAPNVVETGRTNLNAQGFCVITPMGSLTNTDNLTYTNVVYTNQQLCYANIVTYTNQQTCYTNIITAVAVTNAISFVGTVVPGRRFSMLASTPAGKVTYSGVPDVPLADISGSWYGTKHVGKLWYNELFTLTRVVPDANVYTVTGGGSATTYGGVAYLLPQRQLGIVLGIYPVFPVGADENAAPPTIRGVVGSFNPRRLSGALHGLEGEDFVNIQRFNFAIQHR